MKQQEVEQYFEEFYIQDKMMCSVEGNWLIQKTWRIPWMGNHNFQQVEEGGLSQEIFLFCDCFNQKINCDQATKKC